MAKSKLGEAIFTLAVREEKFLQGMRHAGLKMSQAVKAMQAKAVIRLQLKDEVFRQRLSQSRAMFSEMQRQRAMRSSRSGGGASGGMKIGAAAQGIGGVAGGFLGGLSGIAAAAGIQSLTSAVVDLGKAMISTNAEMETGQVAFSAILKTSVEGIKSEERAAAMMLAIREMAAKTPFEIPGLTKAVQGLLGVGVAAQNVLPMLRKLGDAASGSTVGMDALPRMVKAITDMRSKRKIGADDMKQITELGIPAWDALAEAMGKSTAEVQALSKNGRLGMNEIDLLIDGLEAKFPNMMEKMSKTFAGKLSTMRDNFRILIQDIGTPLFELAKQGLTAMNEWFDSESAKAWMASVKEGMAWLIDSVKTGLQNPLIQAALKFSAIAIAIGTAVAGALAFGAAIISGIAGLAAAASTVYGVIAGLLSALGPFVLLLPIAAAEIAAIGALLTAAGIAAMALFRNALGNSQIQSSLGSIRDLIVEIWRNLSDGLTPAFTSLWETMQGALATVQSFFNSTVMSAMKGLRDILDYLSLLTTDFPLGFQLILAEGRLMWSEMKALAVEAFQAWISHQSGVLAGMRAMIMEFVDWVANQFLGMGIDVGGIAAGIKGAFSLAFTGMKSMLMAIIEALGVMGSVAKEAVAKIVEAFSVASEDVDIAGAFETGKGSFSAGMKETSKKVRESSPVKAYLDEFNKMREDFDEKNASKGGVRFDVAEKTFKRDEIRAELEALRKKKRLTREEEDRKNELEATIPRLGTDEEKSTTPPAKSGKSKFLGLAEFSKSIQTSLSTDPSAKRDERIAKATEKAAKEAEKAAERREEMLDVSKEIRDYLSAGIGAI